MLDLTLKGIQRSLGNKVVRKSPITPLILEKLHSCLNPASLVDSAFWAAALVAFFGLLRKSNLMPDGRTHFDGSKQLSRGDFTLYPGSISVYIKWSKTNQFKQRSRSLPLPRLPDHPLCPVAAVHGHFRQSVVAASTSPAFLVSVSPPTPLSSDVFTRRLKECLNTLGYDKNEFSTHSFRRGGACFLLQCGFSSDEIRLLGDWQSDAYMAYLNLDDKSLVKIYSKFSSKILSL